MKLALSLFCIAAAIVGTSTAHAATAVTPATAATIDTDADGIPDLQFSGGYGNAFDNAPSFNNPSQADNDGDQYGDAIDPNSSAFGPVVDIEFTIGGNYNVAPGAGVTINFSTIASPPGNFGHINLYLQPGGTPDAYAFQSLATPGGSFFIPANLLTIPGFWDLNTPGVYTVEAWGLSPGPIAGYKGGTATVTVVPEPTSAVLLSLGALGLLMRRRSIAAKCKID
jgi:hypothetical protein